MYFFLYDVAIWRKFDIGCLISEPKSNQLPACLWMFILLLQVQALYKQ